MEMCVVVWENEMRQAAMADWWRDKQRCAGKVSAEVLLQSHAWRRQLGHMQVVFDRLMLVAKQRLRMKHVLRRGMLLW